MHFRVFETWRLIAALLVMIYHFLRFAPPGHEPAAATLYRMLPLMEMFFMISGFLIMLRYADTLGREPGAYRKFIVRRLARFYPLYLATVLFFTAIAIAVHFGWATTASPDRFVLSALPANLLMVQAWGFTDTLTFNYVSWSISAEWFCYLLLPVIVLCHRRLGLVGLAGLAILSIMVLETATGVGLIPFDSWLKADTWGAYRAFADFVLGALVAVAVRRDRTGIRSHWPGWILFGLSVAAMLAMADSYLVVALLAAAMYLAAVAEANNPHGAAWLAPLHPVGRVSLGIYLLHPVIEALLLSVLWRMLVEPAGFVGYYVYWLLPMAATISLAIASERWFETPAARLVGQWFGADGARNRKRAVVPAE